MAAAERQTNGSSLETAAERIIDQNWSLADDLEGEATSARMREIVRMLIDRIELDFEQQPLGERERYPFSKGRQHIRQGSDIFGLDCRSDWRSFERLVAAYVDAAFLSSAESVVATQVLGISA